MPQHLEVPDEEEPDEDAGRDQRDDKKATDPHAQLSAPGPAGAEEGRKERLRTFMACACRHGVSAGAQS